MTQRSERTRQDRRKPERARTQGVQRPRRPTSRPRRIPLPQRLPQPGTAADNTTDIVTNATSTTEQRRRRRRRPRDRVRGAAGRRLPTVKRTATATQTYRAPTSGDSAGGDGQLKKRKDMAADVEPKSRSVDEPQLDPTLERRRSFSRIPTGSRQQ